MTARDDTFLKRQNIKAFVLVKLPVRTAYHKQKMLYKVYGTKRNVKKRV